MNSLGWPSPAPGLAAAAVTDTSAALAAAAVKLALANACKTPPGSKRQWNDSSEILQKYYFSTFLRATSWLLAAAAGVPQRSLVAPCSLSVSVWAPQARSFWEYRANFGQPQVTPTALAAAAAAKLAVANACGTLLGSKTQWP